MNVQSKIWLISSPEGLFDFVGIANPESKEEIAKLAALVGMHSASISMLEKEGVDEDAPEVRAHARGVADAFNALGEILASYDVRLSMIPTVQMLFFLHSPANPEDATPIDSIEAFWNAKEDKAFLPLTAGVINEFLSSGGLISVPNCEEGEIEDPYNLFDNEGEKRMATNEPWNVGGAVTVEEDHDHNMTDEERQETLKTLFGLDRLIGAIRVKLLEGAPIAAGKTFNDLDCVRDYLSFIWRRVENWTPPQAKDEKGDKE